MALGSLVGFAVVFVLVAWTLSGVLLLARWLGRHELRRLGPAAERGAAEVVAVLPLLIAVAVVAVLVGRSLLGVDHCDQHLEHVHLCVWHGDPWSEHTIAATMVAFAAALFMVRSIALGVVVRRRLRSIAQLRDASEVRDGVRWIDTNHALCFVAGLRRPEIYISTGAWNALARDERQAMLAHERAHVRHRDVVRGLALDLLLLGAAPWVPRVRGTWDAATERLCDAHAAAETSGTAVASALVKVCRIGLQGRLVPSFTPAAAALEDRVVAVLAAEPAGERAARRLRRGFALMAGSLVLAIVVHAGTIHHLLESTLG